MIRALALLALAANLDSSPAAEPDFGRLPHEIVVNAPAAEVWAAFTTKAGMESWMVAHADIDLKVGGRWRTHYDPKGELGDANGIEHTILAVDPKRMIAFRTVKAPAKFPFPKAIKEMWTIVYFEDVGQNRTHVTVASMGFTDDDESKKMRAFFDKGNEHTLKQLQKRFVGKK